MEPRHLPVALVSFLALVALVPAVTYFAGEHSALTTEDAFLAALVLPAMAALLATGWVRPDLARDATGVFVLVAVMALVPWLFKLTDMAAGQLGGEPLAQLLVRFVVPVLVLAFTGGLGYRRVRGRLA